MRIVGWTLCIAAAAALTSCVSALPGVPSAWTPVMSAQRCGLAGGVLRLTGPTDAAMLDCVEALGRIQADTVVLSSSGGRVDTAIRIAERLQPLHAEMVVADGCHSSCANYFLPVARRIRLEPGALILLHGSIDAMFVGEYPGAAGLAEQQANFAATHDVHLGWLLYRTPEEGARRAASAHLTGRQETWRAQSGEARIRMVAVEEMMLRSCLPDVEVVPFVDTFTQRARADAGLRRRMTHQGAYPSGSMVCRR